MTRCGRRPGAAAGGRPSRRTSTSPRELLVRENEELKASLFRGLADAAEGKVKRLDWLTGDADDDQE